MAKWFVGQIIEKLMGKLIDTCTEYLQDQFRSQTGMEELERLRENHLKIQAVVSTVSPAQMIDPDLPLNKWIWQLRDALDEADDVLDDFEYLKHEEQLVRNTEETKKRPSSSSPFGIAQKLHRVGESALKIDPNLARLKEVVQKLDRVLADVSNFLPLLESTRKLQQEQELELYQTRETGSLPKIDFIGREKEKKFVIQWLTKRPNEEHQSHGTATMYNNISLLSIVAHGGMGKTTLLQHVYEDEITKEFDPKMWVCVSNNFDFKKVLADMLGTTRSSLESLDTLQNNLKSKVLSKKFLLVLDDIWEEDEELDKSKWENVLAPLAHGGLGSKILMTTRMKSTASMIAKVIKKKNEPLILEGLEEDECLQLLNTHAFPEDVVNPNVDKKLRSITEKLVKKLYGSPLAAKVMGGVLNSSSDESYWTNVSNNVLGYNEISSILKLSYILLPKYLQNCFAFCSIFPQDHAFDEDDLIRMWIAVGFIQPSNNRGEDVEDIGRSYFDTLVKKSFFDKHVHKNCFEKDVIRYKMHDLLHDLAQFVSKQECFRVMGGEELLSKIPETVRHLSVKTSELKLLKMMGKFKMLRTLCIIYPGQDHQDFVNVLTDVFEETRGIRLLSITALSQTMIPETIGCLKHLRYLKLYFSNQTLLPISISNLYHLQFLIWEPGFANDDLFPRNMNKLSNLRFLMTPHYKFPGIGKLKFLQKVDKFVVKHETGYRIEELQHTNDLRILGIRGLQNVRDPQEACNAKLCDKKKLTKLSLEWEATSQNIADLDIYVKVLNNLQPHNHLNNLTISNYMGVRSAKWMDNANLINNLQEIILNECLEWQILPPFGQLPFLKSLSLCNMPKVKRLDNKFHGNDMCCGFPSLERLFIKNVPQLQEIPDLSPSLCTLYLHNLDNLNYLPSCLPSLSSLIQVTIKSVPQLRELPDLLPSLRELLLENLDNLNCLPSCLPSLSSLTCLNINGVPQLRELPDLPPSLCTLHLNNLDNLNCLPSCLPSLSSPKNLSISKVPQLRELPDLPPSLCGLKLENLDNLNCLPSCLPSLSSLKWLNINGVPQLRELPDLPPSLCTLHLHNLDNLNCLPSCLPTLSSLRNLFISKVPQLWDLPDLPPSLSDLSLHNLDNLNCLPSCLRSLSSLTWLSISKVPQLRELPDLPPTLRDLLLKYLDNLKYMPSFLPSLSSLTEVAINSVPQLRELRNLPSSLSKLYLENLDNLNCLPSCLPTLSSLTWLKINRVPQLRELPDLPPSLRGLNLKNLDNLNCLPSCLPSLSSLTILLICKVPQLQELPDLPPSLYILFLKNLDNLNCLPPCLPSHSSIYDISIDNVPQLRELPDLPPSLCILQLNNLDNLNYQTSLPLSSLKYLAIKNVPQLQELADNIPPSLIHYPGSKCYAPDAFFI